MIKFGFLLVVLGLGLPQSNWKSFVEESNLFTILSPGQMKTQEKFIESSTGDYLLKSVFYESNIDSTDNFLYLINYYEIQENLYSMDSLELNVELLEQMATDMAGSLDNGQLLYTSPVTDKTYSSVEYRVVYGENKANLKGKFLLTASHLYSIQVYTTSKKALNNNMDLFIDSFRVMLK